MNRNGFPNVVMPKFYAEVKIDIKNPWFITDIDFVFFAAPAKIDILYREKAWDTLENK